MSKKVYTIEEIKRKLEHYCVYQDRCHQEVEKKLYDYALIVEAREHILLHLLEHNFLNEERFSKSFARGKFRIKKWGKLRIVRELRQRNISAYNIRTALKEIDDEDYINTLYAIVGHKSETINESNIYKKKKKIIDHLRYRGYETDVIFKAVNETVK